MSHVRLTISCPRMLEDQLVELLLGSPLLSNGFSTINASNHGSDFAHASLRERVRGCVDASLFIAVIPSGDCAQLIVTLRARFRSGQIRYWTEPVLEFGDLA